MLLTLKSRIKLFSSDASRDADFRKILTYNLQHSITYRRLQINFPEALKNGVTSVTNFEEGVISSTSMLLTLKSRIKLFSSDASRDADFRKILTYNLQHSITYRRLQINFPEALKNGVTSVTFLCNIKTFLHFT